MSASHVQVGCQITAHSHGCDWGNAKCVRNHGWVCRVRPSRVLIDSQTMCQQCSSVPGLSSTPNGCQVSRTSRLSSQASLPDPSAFSPVHHQTPEETSHPSAPTNLKPHHHSLSRPGCWISRPCNPQTARVHDGKVPVQFATPRYPADTQEPPKP